MTSKGNSNFCYNCNDSSHYSINCPQDQLYTRCPTCNNVCFGDDGHKRLCSNISFRSSFKSQFDRVVETSLLLELTFKGINDVAIRVGDDMKRVGSNPLWLPEHSLQIKCVDGWLCFDGDKNKSYTIAVIDSNGKRRIKMSMSNKMLINTRYTVEAKGFVKYDMSAYDASHGYAHCTVQVDNIDVLFYAKAKWKANTLFMDSYPEGVILKDPFELHLRKRSLKGELSRFAKQN